MKIYYELEIAFNKHNYNIIYETLYLNQIKAIIEENGTLKISVPENELYILNSVQNKLVTNRLVNAQDMHISKLENLDWNKEWERTIEPVYIKDKIVIYPSWKKGSLNSPAGRILIEIDPKMSFGTGHNETTQLILELMCGYLTSKEETMLDFGCGTGILSIAGIKLGIKKAVAIDLDEDAIVNANEYLKTNKVVKNISLYRCDIREVKEKDFDVVCANITSMIIMDSLPLIQNKLKPKGKLFVSGILKDEVEEVKRELLKSKFEIIVERCKTEWASFYCLKR